MRSLRYLNGVLTILAILLSLQLWTSWTLSSSASGTARVLGPQSAYAAGIPNAGAQRKEMVDLLKKQVKQTEALTEMFQSGKARVRVERRGKDD